MILINPRGKEVDYPDEKAKKILSMEVKKRQGWRKKRKEKQEIVNEVDEAPKKKVNKTPKKKVNKTPNKKVNG